MENFGSGKKACLGIRGRKVAPCYGLNIFTGNLLRSYAELSFLIRNVY